MKEEIPELLKQKEINLDDYSDHQEVIDALDYDGSLHELIDGQIDIYYYDLRKWAVDNWSYVEDAINEGLVDTSDFDYHKAIQSGQYLYWQEQANETIEEIFASM